MTAPRFILFATPLGCCGIVWGERGVVGVQLPQASDAATRARVLRRFPDARVALPPADVRCARDGIVALLRGHASDLSSIVLDLDRMAPFQRRVYAIARGIAPGATCTYGELAAQLGVPGAARAVGRVLGRNPFAIVVPCHRVLAAGGKPGGFSASGGVATKLRLLALEAAGSNGQRGLFDGADGAPDDAFGFDSHVAVEHLRASDATLARVIDAVGPFRMELKKASSLFGVLVEAIVHQQLSAKAAATIFARVCALFPTPHAAPGAEQILQVADESLRGAGLSHAKVRALRDLARKAAAGMIPTLAQARQMLDAELVECLTQVRGIGRWTVEMLLMFRLGRADVLPADDYGIRKSYALAFKRRELPTRIQLEKRAARWTPYRTVASWYLWRALELAKARAARSIERRRKSLCHPADAAPIKAE